MQCSRCGNQEQKYFYEDRGIFYCRKCIQFGRVNVTDVLKKPQILSKKHKVHAQLDFELTDAQKECSEKLKQAALAQKDCLVYACCGAGKTEICFEVITTFLNMGKKVGFAISRRQVVLEITKRFRKAYPTLKIVSVCQGYTDITDGDLIVCTMHQLYRYYQTFDLLIMDEVDAFPYKGNDVLKPIAMQACLGSLIYLSATPDEEMLKDVAEGRLEMIELFVRPHGHPLIVPTLLKIPGFLQELLMLILIIRHPGQWMIFLPTIDQVRLHSSFYHLFLHSQGITSKTKNKEEIMESFQNKEFSILFTSTILERGITIQGVNILVLFSDHVVFDESSLIQIVGRVGRNWKQPTGYAYLAGATVSHAMKRCRDAIRRMNEDLPDLFS